MITNEHQLLLPLHVASPEPTEAKICSCPVPTKSRSSRPHTRGQEDKEAPEIIRRRQHNPEAVNSLIKLTLESAKLEKSGEPLEKAAVSIIRDRDEWRYIAPGFLQSVRREGIMSILGLSNAGSSRHDRRTSETPLNVIVFASPDGRVVGLDQRSLLDGETEFRRDLKSWSAIPPSLRDALESEAVAVVGHDIQKRWSTFFRPRGITIRNGLECRTLFKLLFRINRI